MSGGSSATKGFLLQALVCILEALDDEKWQSITVEPKLDTEKVDIVWNFGNTKKVVQVKSSINQIGISNISQWAVELEQSITADEYQLILLGPISQSAVNIKPVGKVSIPTPKNNDEKALFEQAAFKLDKFLENQNLTVTASAKELIVKTLATDFLCFAIKSTEINKEQFLKMILDNVQIIKPTEVRKNPLNRAIDYIFDLKGWVSTSEQEFYYESFPEFRIIWESEDLREDFFEHWIDEGSHCSLANMEIKLFYHTTVLKIFKAINLEYRSYFPVPKYYDLNNLDENGKAYILRNQIESFVCAIISKVTTIEGYDHDFIVREKILKPIDIYFADFKLNTLIYSINIGIEDENVNPDYRD